MRARTNERAWKLHTWVNRRLADCKEEYLDRWIVIIERLEAEYPPSPSQKAWDKFMNALTSL